MPFIEAPTTFYMGRRYDPNAKALTDDVVYYDSRDLTTHAVVVGMTGSGKTGMCIALLEEAVLDNIPAICIDPKGDITNLLLTFPNLRPEDFEPWVNPDDASRSGLDLKEFSKDVAQQWRDGLASWSIVPQRIAAMKNAAQFSIYTPGSDAGLSVSILDSLRAPHETWAGNEEAIREHISGVVIALLALIGKQVEPVKDREHVLIANIFENAWKNGRDLTLEDIILQVQKPPFAKLGVFDINTFFPEKDRFKLATELNHIIAAPSFQSWITGEPMDIQHLLYTPEGRPRVSIFYLAHLNESERSFIITLLLENMLAWMRTLSGTTSLRSLLYFDEVFGHFPPAPYNPPTKDPLLRLLKQGRAFGIGVILATQNPGDLDYKGLANAGTWFIGKLQTDNDKKKVLGGLQTAATAANQLDMDKLNRAITGLAPRVFVLHNVHDQGGPTLMHTRWSMSYLRGPLTRQQIRILMDAQRRASGTTPGTAPQPPVTTSAPTVPPPTPSTPAAPIQPLAQVAARPFPTFFTSPRTASSTPSMPPAPPSTLPEAHPSATSTGTPGNTPLPPHLPEIPAAPPPLPDFPVAEIATPPVTDPANNAFYPYTPSSNVANEVPAVVSNTSQPVQTGNATLRGAALPDGYHDRPAALPSSMAQFYLPTQITVQQAIRNWEKNFGYQASAFGGSQLLYKPVLLAQAVVRYKDRKTGAEDDERWAFQVDKVDAAGFVRWSDYQSTPVDPTQLSQEPFGAAFYGPLPVGLTDNKRMTALKGEVVDYVYRSAALNVFYNSTLDIYGKPRESRRDYLLRIQQKAREERDAEIDTTTAKYDALIQKIEDKLQKELQGMGIDQQTLKELKRENLYTTGEAVFGLLRGRPGYALSRMSRTRIYKTRAQGRVQEGENNANALEAEITSKQQELQQALKDINDKWAKVATTVEEIKVTPFKKDITLELFGIGWLPAWQAVLNGNPVILPAFTPVANTTPNQT